MTRRLRTGAAVATRVSLCLAAMAALAPRTAGAELRVEVSGAQRVTVTGRTESLRAAIEDLCLAAGVELRGYGAEDRPVTANFEDEPLARVLERLLREEAYMVGVRGGTAGAPQVKWLRVMGTAPGASAMRVAPVPPAGPAPSEPESAGLPPTRFGVAPEVATAALSEPDPVKRQAAVDQIVQHVGQDPTTLDRLLTEEVSALVGEIGGQAHAVALFQAIQGAQTDAGVRWKVEGVIRSLRLRNQQLNPKRDLFRPAPARPHLPDQRATHGKYD